MTNPAQSIRIGTMISGNKTNAAERIAEIAHLGFESFEPFFWQTTNGQDLAELGKRCVEAIGDRDIAINALGMFGNPLEDTRDRPRDAAGLEGLHRQRPPFRRDASSRASPAGSAASR